MISWLVECLDRFADEGVFSTVKFGLAGAFGVLNDRNKYSGRKIKKPIPSQDGKINDFAESCGNRTKTIISMPPIIDQTASRDFFDTGMLPYNELIPKIKPPFVITEPSELPSASSVAWLAIATKLVENSGKVVPIETMVAPIIISGTPKISESSMAFSVR